MKSPFPGMDPYLEQYWRDVHHTLITYARDQLQPGLPAGLKARAEERVFVEPDDGDVRCISPDVYVVEHRPALTSGGQESGGVAVADSVLIDVSSEPVRQGFIEIIDAASGNRVVTVIEFLSPSNKTPGEGQNLYLKKREELREGGVNLVEIDLTRSGKRNLSVPDHRIPRAYRTTYQICIRRSHGTRRAEVFRAPLQQRLPTIPIPLRETDAEVRLDLQALIDRCYENGRYDDTDYRREPVPSLEPADAAWADEMLRSAGKR